MRHVAMAPCLISATTPISPELLRPGPNPHERKTRSRSFAPWDRPHQRSLRYRHGTTGEGLARHGVPGDRRTAAGRSRTVDRALVPGSAGVSDVGTEPGRPPYPRRFSAAGPAAAANVGRWRRGILLAVAA